MSNVPLCRSRVLYIGSAVPFATKDGLQGIQQPLKERYPANGTEVKGIDSWLSVWSNGLLLEYIDGNEKTEGAFHPIINLHYCAAVRYVTDGREGGERFIPLDSAYGHNSQHPPIFAAIFRRATGIKVLECHAFICTDERVANSLVRCCFHSYADTAFLKIEDKLPNRKAIKNGSLGERPETPTSEEQQTSEQLTTDDNRDDIDWEERAIGQKTWQRRQQSADYDDMISTESSVHKKPMKRNKKNDTQSEVFENGTIIPYNEPRFRRSGSQPDIHSRPPFEPHFPFHGPPHMHHPHMHHPNMHHPNMHPPHFAPPPPGHHFRGRSVPPQMFPPSHPFGKSHQFHPGAVPPHFYGPQGGRQMPPHPMFMPPPHFGKHPQFHPQFHPMFMPQHFGYPPQHPQQRAPTVPIIETIYDTYPRRGGNYEESIYIPSNGTLPPNSTYKPSPGEHYEGFYESYKRPGKANGLHSDSDTSVDDSQFWDTYETGAYRKINPNEKPNRNVTPKTQQKSQNYSDSSAKRPEQVQHSTPKIDTRQKRPSTPEIDYDDKFGNIIVNDKSSTHQSKRQAAVF